MRADKLVQYLDDLNELEFISLSDLQSITNRYPFSSNLQFLVAKKMQLVGDTENMRAFQNLTNYIPNKHHLYERFANSECEFDINSNESKEIDQFIEKQFNELDQKELGIIRSQEESIKAKVESLAKELEEEEEEEELTVEVAEIDAEEGIVLENEISEIEVLLKEEDPIEEIPELIETVVDQLPFEREQTDLDYIEVEAWKMKATKKKKKKKRNREQALGKESEKQTELDASQPTEKQRKSKKIKKSKIKKERIKVKKSKKKDKNTPSKNNLVQEEFSSFTSWLSSLKNESKDSREYNEDAATKPKKVKKPKKKKGKAVKISSSKEKTKKKKPKKLRFQDKIDSSLELKPAIASETLAVMMARQGNTEQAINIYKQLILQNPEKSSYFADQIKKLD